MKKRLVGIAVVLALVFAVMSLSVSAPPGPLGVPPAGGNGGGLPSPTGSYGGLYTPAKII